MNNGGPAFPRILGANTGTDTVKFVEGSGMSLRDWFAGMAISGFTSAQDRGGIWQSVGCEKEIAHHCFRIADAMLKERENEL